MLYNVWLDIIPIPTKNPNKIVEIIIRLLLKCNNEYRIASKESELPNKEIKTNKVSKFGLRSIIIPVKDIVSPTGTAHKQRSRKLLWKMFKSLFVI